MIEPKSSEGSRRQRCRGGGGGCQLHPAWVRSVFLSQTLHKPFREKKRHKGALGPKCTQGLGGIVKENGSLGLPLPPLLSDPKTMLLNSFAALVPVTKELISGFPERSDDPAQLLSPDTRQEATRPLELWSKGEIMTLLSHSLFLF